MTPADVQMIAKELDSPGKLLAFLTDLFAALSLKNADREQLRTVLPTLLGPAAGATPNPDPAAAAGSGTAAESARRLVSDYCTY